MFVLFFIAIASISAYPNDPFVCPSGGSSYLPVNLPTGWLNGSIDCFNQSALRPDLDVFRVNNDTFILRENKCINYEAPFMYLLFSNNTVLLIDSGATVSLVSLPIQQHVETLILHWCISHDKEREAVDLVVAHTHNHNDHTAGDAQFQYKLFTTIVNTSVEAVSKFFKIDNWPNSIGTYELDSQRHLAIIPIPGHQEASIAFYDCATGLLITGDSLLPGRLYISNFSASVDSISRLVNFIETNRLNITSILGAHIEMTNESKIDYPIGATYQPKERQLNMSLEQLHQLNNELQEQSKAGFNQRHKAYYDTFIFDPKPSELPLLPPDGRVSTHGFVVLPLAKTGYVLMSHKPMFRSPHDFQLVFLATITNSTVEPIPLPTNVSRLNNQWTVQPEQWSLNNLINGNLTSFRSQLYIGDFEQGGTYLCNITINIIRPLLTVVQLNISEVEPYLPLRYISYLLTNSTTSSKPLIHLYLLHQIRVQPDFDAIAHVIIDPTNCTTDIDRSKLNNLLEQNGNEWAFHGIVNDIGDRLTGEIPIVRGQLLGDIYSTSCKMQVIEEIQCTMGPEFYDDCNV
jgi:glyoxylase-like metal-dependent hydrolase (beta-lactamase superfamily II)